MRQTIARYRGLAFVCAALAILAAPPHGFPWPKVALVLYLVVVSYLRLRAGIVLLPVISCLTATYLYHRVPALRPFGTPASWQVFTAWAPALAGWIVYLGLSTRAIYLERGMPGVPDAGAVPEEPGATVAAVLRRVGSAAAVLAGILVLHELALAVSAFAEHVVGEKIFAERASRRFMALFLFTILVLVSGASLALGLRRAFRLSPLEARAALLGAARRLVGKELRLLMRRSRP